MKKIWNVAKWIIGIAVTILIVSILGLTVWHQVSLLTEREEMSSIGERVEVNGRNVRVYQTGTGSQTIILLSGQGTLSPILDFKPMADALGEKYRVVVIEYLGYGLSDDTDMDQTSDNIVEEIRSVMKQLNINPPYVLMPHSMSGIYAMRYIQEYPQEIQAVVGIDPTVPNQCKYEPEMKVSNSVLFLTKAMDITGITRLQLMLPFPYLDDMQAGGEYSQRDIRLIKAICSKRSISKAQQKENNLFHENCKAMYDWKYPDTLQVLSFLSTESCKRMEEFMKSSGNDATWAGLHLETFSNDRIQSNVLLDGGHYLQWTQKKSLVEKTFEFLEKTCKSE